MNEIEEEDDEKEEELKNNNTVEHERKRAENAEKILKETEEQLKRERANHKDELTQLRKSHKSHLDQISDFLNELLHYVQISSNAAKRNAVMADIEARCRSLKFGESMEFFEDAVSSRGKHDMQEQEEEKKEAAVVGDDKNKKPKEGKQEKNRQEKIAHEKNLREKEEGWDGTTQPAAAVNSNRISTRGSVKSSTAPSNHKS